ncbi:MAG TPA: alpha/beta fold hydrolase [Candidatus Krumholzibacteria bacterium]
MITAGWTLALLLLSVVSATAGEREVSFQNGTVELKGTILTPATGGRHPAVVFLHGSGPATRDGARAYAEEFAKLGLVSLFFDKRGCGASGGSWTQSSLEDLANDALAATALLAQQPDVDPARIGLWGVSQAGWVATVAASKSKDVAFLVLITGGGATPREVERYGYERAFANAGLGDADKAEAFAVIDRYFNYLATGQGRADVAARLEKSQTAAWYPYARLDRILPSEENRANWSWVATWDPAASMAKITCPTLLMFGSKDEQVPTDVAVKKWREGLQKAGNKDVTLVVFPDASHGLRLGEHRPDGRAPFADGYAELMLGWLWYHVVKPAR